MKIKCECGKKAIWTYVPHSRYGNLDFCDDCVPRGCSCNDIPYLEDGSEPNVEQLFDDNVIKVYVPDRDEQGREFPCCEYWCDEEGWDDYKT